MSFPLHFQGKIGNYTYVIMSRFFKRRNIQESIQLCNFLWFINDRNDKEDIRKIIGISIIPATKLRVLVD